MRKGMLTLIATLIICSLFSNTNRYDVWYNYSGNELASRSTDPRITQIAHVTTTPTLNSYESQAKTQWDALFTTLCQEASTMGHEEYLNSTDINYWTSFTPKEIV